MEEDLFMVKSLPKDFQNLKEQANSILTSMKEFCFIMMY
jgi:hypothetical protein